MDREEGSHEDAVAAAEVGAAVELEYRQVVEQLKNKS